jgi:ribosomal protein S10
MLRNVKVPKIDIKSVLNPPRTNNQLVCNIELKAFMPDHLDLIAHFTKHQANVTGIPTSEIIHLISKTKKFSVTKGPFVHAKSKQIFEQKTHKRLIQMFDAHPETIDKFVGYLNGSLPCGIDMKVTKFQFEELGYKHELLDDKLPKGHLQIVESEMKKYLKKFAKK